MKQLAVVMIAAVLILGCSPISKVLGNDSPAPTTPPLTSEVAPTPPPTPVTAEQRLEEAKERLGLIIEGAANLDIARVSTMREIEALEVIIRIEKQIKETQAERAEPTPAETK